MLWDALGRFGVFGAVWAALGCFGAVWGALGRFGALRGALEWFGALWGSLGTFRCFWALLDALGCFWVLWGTLGRFWVILDAFGRIWVLLELQDWGSLEWSSLWDSPLMAGSLPYPPIIDQGSSFSTLAYYDTATIRYIMTLVLAKYILKAETLSRTTFSMMSLSALEYRV